MISRKWKIAAVNPICMMGLDKHVLRYLTNSVSLSFSLPYPLPLLPLYPGNFDHLLPWTSPHPFPSFHIQTCRGDHIYLFLIMRGSSDTVCSPCSARLLLHSWSGLEVSHYSCMPSPHHWLLPGPSRPAEWLHRGLLWSPPRSRHGQVSARNKSSQLCLWGLWVYWTHA